MKLPRILLIDLENTPQLGYFFGKVYETNILSVTEQSYILSVAYCWYPSKKVKVISLPDFKGYRGGNDCEEQLLQQVWKLLDEADIVVSQNGQAFDTKHLNTRFAYYRMQPPSPYAQVDTLQGLRRAFNLPSNKLDFVCTYFGIGKKLPHTGKDLWFGCMQGIRSDWKVMCRYNSNDVYPLLYDLYELLRPWTKHPNLNFFSSYHTKCPKCGGAHLQKRGSQLTRSRVTQRLQCMSCGSWCMGESEKLSVKIDLR